jgi:tetratricopeptide (TPR) repeat protein
VILGALNQIYYADADRFAQLALERFRRHENRRGESATLSNIAAAAYFQGDYAQARAAYEQTLSISALIGDRLAESDALGNLGAVAREQGDYAQARMFFEQAIIACRAIDNRWGETAALNGLGNVALAQGNYDTAQALQGAALQLSRQIGYRLFEGIALVNLGEALLAVGAFEQAAELLDEGQRQFHEAGDQRNESWALAVRALVEVLRGDAQTAVASSAAACRRAREVGARAEEGLALTVHGRALEALDRPETVLVYEQAVALWRELGEHRLILDAHAGSARLALARGHTGQARTLVQPILEYLRQAGMLEGASEPLLVLLTCVRVLLAEGDAEGDRLLELGYSVLRERAGALGDQAVRIRFLERIPAHRELAALWERRASHIRATEA